MLTDSERDSLRLAAAEAADNAHAPYSEFRVGAAVLGARSMYRGTNVENASYGLALCAERSALSAAVAAGDREIRGLAVACVDADPAAGTEERMPCGACRQWILELAPDAEILIQGVDEVLHIADLLPRAFRLGRK
jgi:cytidine deaminase